MRALKTVIYLILLVLISCSSKSKEPEVTYIEHEKFGKLRKECMYSPDSTKKTCSTYYENDVLAEYETYVNGKTEGYYGMFDMNGNKLRLVLYKNGEPTTLRYFKLGIPYFEMNPIEETMTYWYQTGEVYSITGTVDDIEKHFYQTGELMAQGKISGDANPEGEWLYYDKSGNVIREVRFDNGDTINDEVINQEAITLLQSPAWPEE